MRLACCPICLAEQVRINIQPISISAQARWSACIGSMRVNNARKKNRKVLIFRFGSLGDTVVALPCFHLVSHSFSEYERILLTNRPRYATSLSAFELLSKSHLVDTYWTVGKGRNIDLIKYYFS